MTAGIIINPAAGSRRRHKAEAAVRRAQAALRTCSVEGDVCVTEQRGDARELTRSMIAAGARTVVAWGGDGTINEVAAEVAAAGATLGVVPGGSGNGFARGLGLERHAEAALRTALSGPVRVIDTGSIDGRVFVNVAGIGFDAHMAAVFNGLRRRGAPAYFRAGVRELRSYRAATYTVRTAEETFTMPAFLVAVANCREYGNGALIAPGARPDDGVLDLVCIPARRLPWLLCQSFRLFAGTIDRLPGIRRVSGTALELAADRPLAFHVDGEVYAGERCLRVRVDAASLRVRVPRGRESAPQEFRASETPNATAGRAYSAPTPAAPPSPRWKIA